MTVVAEAVFVIAVVCLLCSGCEAFTTSRGDISRTRGPEFHIGMYRQADDGPLQPLRMSSDESSSPSGGDRFFASRHAPFLVKKLNSSTKWLVTLAHTLAVWTRPGKFHGPYIVVGSIASVYLADVLKGWINQGRPDGAPIVDPGMPSSHALVSFFSAAAWAGVLGTAVTPHRLGQALLLAAATAVAVLRVVCGYHTVAQIAVGGVLGSVLGQLWAVLGEELYATNPMLTFRLSWIAYLSGSALFISKKISKWTTTDKHI